MLRKCPPKGAKQVVGFRWGMVPFAIMIWNCVVKDVLPAAPAIQNQQLF